MVEKVAKTKKYYKNQCQNNNFWCQDGFFLKETRLKNRQKMECKWEGVLISIFNSFWLILAPKLDPKIEEKSIPKVLKKLMEKRLWQRWVKSRNLNPEGCAAQRFWVQGEGIPLRTGWTPRTPRCPHSRLQKIPPQDILGHQRYQRY